MGNQAGPQQGNPQQGGMSMGNMRNMMGGGAPPPQPGVSPGQNPNSPFAAGGQFNQAPPPQQMDQAMPAPPGAGGKPGGPPGGGAPPDQGGGMGGPPGYGGFRPPQATQMPMQNQGGFDANSMLSQRPEGFNQRLSEMAGRSIPTPMEKSAQSYGPSAPPQQKKKKGGK